MTEDTRQNPSNRPALPDSEQEPDMSEDIESNPAKDLEQLLVDRVAVERFYHAVNNAGKDGLSEQAKIALKIGLSQLKLPGIVISNEDYVGLNISAEDLKEQLAAIGRKIMEVIEKLIDKAKELGSRIMSGIDGVINEAEELIKRAKSGKGPAKQIANELHDDSQIAISAPAILWADGEFCIGDCKSELEVIKFFQTTWPKYAEQQINRAKTMVGEYDVESGNSENFRANADFIGNHQSLVNGITQLTLPGNKKIAFKYVALGPELVDAEGAKPAPPTIDLDVRDSNAIQHTLRANIEHMKQLSKLFAAEAEVLHQMKTLSQAVMELENRRGETIFKGARDDLDTITQMVMGLVNRLNPNYDPIVRHLAKVGTARNLVCRKELDARGG